MKEKIIKLISSFLYLGYCPIMPGTVGSLAGVWLYLLLRLNNQVYLIALVLITLAGFLVSRRAEALFDQRDSPKIVIDEIAGILLSLYLVPAKIPLIFLGFIIFRALDAIKPPPFDRLDRLPGSIGIMADDLGAGLYTNLILQIVMRLVAI